MGKSKFLEQVFVVEQSRYHVYECDAQLYSCAVCRSEHVRETMYREAQTYAHIPRQGL